MAIDAFGCTQNQDGRGARRGNNGCADRGAPGQCRLSRSPARRVASGGARGLRTRKKAQTRSAVHARRQRADQHGRVRSGSRADCRSRLDHRGYHRAGRRETQRCSSASMRCAGRTPSSARTHPACRYRGCCEGRSDAFRAHWLGTHFFNPPRYLPLLEIIPTEATDPAVVAAVQEFAEIGGWARTWSSPRIRQASSRTMWRCTAW